MLAIASENNLAETAFYVRQAPGRYGLRWFTRRWKSICADTPRWPPPA